MENGKEKGKKKKILIVVVIVIAVIGALIAGSLIKNGKMCQFDGGCENESYKAQGVSNSEFCSEHSCDEPNCENQCTETSGYCEKHEYNHTCVYNCDKKAVRSSDYCEDHKCKYSYCDRFATGYCSSHKCGMCDAGIDSGDMCSKHKDYEYCNSCGEYAKDVELRTIAGGDTQDYTGEKYEWCGECWADYKELSIYD